MSLPLVSVLIPCFNYGRYLDFAVDSILQQTFQNVEIIIINDGSTDTYTVEKLKNYTKPKTSVIHQINRYPSAARNYGFSHSNGQYILTLDADDMFERTFLEKAIHILERDHQYTIGAVSSEVLKFGYYDSIWRPRGGNLTNFILGINCVACALIRRKAWELAGGFDETMIEGYEDWDFWIRLTKIGWSIHIIPELLFYYRTKENSRITESFKNYWRIYNRIRWNHPDVFEQYLAGENVY
jgi:glycosyltransferase involved in cell wall biosynthesis